MIITHHKGEFMKVSFGDTTLAFNPISKKSKLPTTCFGADIALISMHHPDFNGVAEVTRANKEPFLVNGPGEYEIQGVFVKGVISESQYGNDTHINTIYAVRLEEMNLLFLGALSDKKPNAAVVEDMDGVDILFVPIGGDGVLEPADAHALAVSFEAKIVIPMHYDGIGAPGSLKAFCKESGVEDITAIEKLTIKKKDIDDISSSVVVLQS